MSTTDFWTAPKARAEKRGWQRSSSLLFASYHYCYLNRSWKLVHEENQVVRSVIAPLFAVVVAATHLRSATSVSDRGYQNCHYYYFRRQSLRD